MTARHRIEELTNAWYGYCTLSAIAALFRDGIPGPFAIVWAALGLGCTLIGVWFVGRRLLARSSLTRFVLLLVTGIGMVFGAWQTGRMALSFVRSWELGVLAAAVFLGVSAYMHAKSFRTLLDRDVRSYFR
jgi:hypothetical protein